MQTTEFILRLTLTIQIIWFIVFFLILMHEFGHAVAAQSLGMRVSKISVGWPVLYRRTSAGIEYEVGLLPWMGYTQVPRLPNATPDQRALFALAGPAASVLLGVILILFSTTPGDYLYIAGHASFTLAAVNLIPLPPMDGWPILQYVYHRISGRNLEASLKTIVLGGLSIGVSVMVVWHYGGL